MAANNIRSNRQKKEFNVKFYPIQHKFVYTHNLIQVIMGPFGSGKSVAALMKIFLYAQCMMPSKYDGIRRSHWIIVRNVRKEIEDTIIKTYLQWFGHLGNYKQSALIDTLRFGDVECHITFLALDQAADVSKLGGLECTGIYFNEVDSINENIFTTSLGRIGRYPSLEADGAQSYFDLEKAKQMGFDLDYTQNRVEMKTVLADSNPPKIGSYYYKLFERLLYNEETGEDENPKNFNFHRQPSGMSAEAENIANLPGGYNYYLDTLNNSTKEVSDVKVHGNYGIGESGLSIYRNYFDRRVHIKHGLHSEFYSGNYKLAIGMDFGLEPACVIGQYINNKLVIYEEIITKNNNKRGLEEFLNDEVLPTLKERYKKHRLNNNDIIILGDPAGNQRNQLNGKRLNDALTKFGFKVRSGTSVKDNLIPPRINAVKTMLKNSSDVVSLMIEENAIHSINGFEGSYYYEKDKNGISDKPVKNTYSHVHDAIQYLCLHVHKYKGRYLDNTNVNLYYNETNAADKTIGY